MLVGTFADSAESLAAVVASNALLELYIVGADTRIYRDYQTQQTTENDTPLAWTGWQVVSSAVNPANRTVRAVRDNRR